MLRVMSWKYRFWIPSGPFLDDLRLKNMVTLISHNRTKLGNHPWDAQRNGYKIPRGALGIVYLRRGGKGWEKLTCKDQAGKRVFCAKNKTTTKQNTMKIDLTLMGELNKIINAYKILRELMGDMFLFTNYSTRRSWSAKILFQLKGVLLYWTGNKYK